METKSPDILQTSRDLHPSHAKVGIKPLSEKLFVVTMMSNPLRWLSRYKNYHAFQNQCATAGAELYTVEIAYGQRPFEVTSSSNPFNLQLRTNDELWHKENALNLLISRLPADAKYIAWIDADVQFTRSDWAQEAMQLLQHYSVIQMFSHAQNLGPNYEPIGDGIISSFVNEYLNYLGLPHAPGKPSTTSSEYGYGDLTEDVSKWGFWGHPGFAWAARKSAISDLGGLIDWAVCGSGDYHMATALVGQVQRSLHPAYSSIYNKWCEEWQNRADQHIRKNVGVMPGLVNHAFHGQLKRRNYKNRYLFLAKAGFNPELDLKRDHQGLWQLTSRNTELRDGLRAYARERNEDATEA